MRSFTKMDEMEEISLLVFRRLVLLINNNIGNKYWYECKDHKQVKVKKGIKFNFSFTFILA